MPGKLLAAHHTVADWDFMHGAQYRELSAETYVSAPTSLKFSGSVVYWYSCTLCRIPATLVLPQGEVRTWAKKMINAFTPCCFRNQAPLGSSSWSNCYYMYFSGTTIYFWRTVGGEGTQVDSKTADFSVEDWSHFRVFWYNGKRPDETPALCVDCYNEIGGEWVKMCATFYDVLNLWKDSEINRCGFNPHLNNLWSEYWDDTEIWGPV